MCKKMNIYFKLLFIIFFSNNIASIHALPTYVADFDRILNNLREQSRNMDFVSNGRTFSLNDGSGTADNLMNLFSSDAALGKSNQSAVAEIHQARDSINKRIDDLKNEELNIKNNNSSNLQQKENNFQKLLSEYVIDRWFNQKT